MGQRQVLIARPLEQARNLAAAIGQAGGTSMLFPTLEIRPIALSTQAQTFLARLASYDIAVFISANAVSHGVGAVQARTAWPTGILTCAVGKATAQALREVGIAAREPTDGNDSEALLRMSELQTVKGKQVLVVRGVGGRELLAQTLRSRGAQVDIFECYERHMPAVDVGRLRTAITGDRIAAIVVSSVEALDNLLGLLDEQYLVMLRDCPVFVSHSRVAARAHEAGLKNAIVTPSGIDATVSALSAYFVLHQSSPHP